jgi:predicted transposase YdaD
MTNASASPHDQFFKELMTQPGVAGAFLRERLPESITAFFTDSEPRLESGSFVDPDLRSQHSDLLFSMDLKSGSPSLVYILFEHEACRASATSSPTWAHRRITNSPISPCCAPA